MNQKEIVEHITPVFLRNGYRSLTMDDVASELAMSKKTLYHFFNSKEALVHSVMENVSHKIKHLMHEIQMQKMGAIEEFLTIKSRIDGFFTGHEQQHCIHELKRYYPKVYETSYNHQVETILTYVKQNIAKGKAEGEYRDDIDEEEITQIFATVILGLKTSETVLDMRDYEIHINNFYEIFLRGISTPKGIQIFEQHKTH